MAETRSLSDRYAELGQALVDTEPSLARVRESHATIVYLASDAAKASRGRAVLGQWLT